MPDQQKGESQGRKDNAATADYPGVSEVTPQAYPAVDQDEAAERTGRTEQVAGGEDRSFEASRDNPQPRQGAGDGATPPATNDGRTGPQGDPAEGKR